jgi:prophage tail gpP-like protein
MPKQKETVTLQVAGQQFTAWEQIQASAEFGTFRDFAFLATEAVSSSGGKSSPNWSTLQIRPGDECTIKFANQKFLNGQVTCRTANYGAVNHNVLLSGRSKASTVTLAAANMKDLDGGQFRGQTWKAIAERVLKNFQGIKLIIRGKNEYMDIPFDDAQVNPGETCFLFLARLANVKALTLMDDDDGNLVAVASIEDAESATGGDLIEGKNIVTASGRIENTTLFPKQINISQRNGNNKIWGRKACQGAAHAESDSVTGYKPYIHLADHPQTSEECVGRTNYEGIWNFNDNIAVDITVVGWQRGGSGDLWKIADKVRVDSPMLMLNQQLSIQRVTFTQDNDQGSLAHLHLVKRLSRSQISITPPMGAPSDAKTGTGK